MNVCDCGANTDNRWPHHDQCAVNAAPVFNDYDAGLLNDFGGGNVEWWQDYLRAEIERANEWWRSQVEAAATGDK